MAFFLLYNIIFSYIYKTVKRFGAFFDKPDLNFFSSLYEVLIIKHLRKTEESKTSVSKKIRTFDL